MGLVEIVHSTLVPGTGLNEQGEPLHPDVPSVLVDPPADALQLLIDHSITGALRLPEEMPGLFARDSIIDSPRRSGSADFSPALISGNLSPFPALGSAKPKVSVTLGDGAHTQPRWPPYRGPWQMRQMRCKLRFERAHPLRLLPEHG